MISSIGQVMLYVTDQEANAKFWEEKAGFKWVEKLQSFDGDYIYIVAPEKHSEFQIVLQDKVKVAKAQPDMNLGTPSILMQSKDLEATHAQLVENGVQVSPITDLPNFKFFNFCDNEQNYFAVKQVQ